MQSYSKIAVVAFSALMAAIVSAPAYAKCNRVPIAVNFPAQRLDERMQAVSQRTGCPFTVDPESLNERQATALKGRLTAARIVAASIKGKGLAPHPDPDGYTIAHN